MPKNRVISNTWVITAAKIEGVAGNRQGSHKNPRVAVWYLLIIAILIIH
jgi:hypothetical protein